MRILTLGNENINIPNNWNELTQKQLLWLASVDFNKLDLRMFRFDLFRVITEIKVKKFRVYLHNEYCYRIKYKRKIYLISVNDLTEILEQLFDFLFKKRVEQTKYGNETTLYVDSKLYKNLLPYIKKGFRKYYGPADALTNITFEEYIRASVCYNNYVKHNKSDYLDMLIATLYRKTESKQVAKINGDCRVAFNDNTISENALKFKNLSPVIKNAIMLYYSGSSYFLMKRYPEVFSGEGSPSASLFDNYQKITDALTKYDPTKKEAVRKMLLYDVLDTLNNTIIESKKKK